MKQSNCDEGLCSNCVHLDENLFIDDLILPFDLQNLLQLMKFFWLIHMVKYVKALRLNKLSRRKCPDLKLVPFYFCQNFRRRQISLKSALLSFKSVAFRMGPLAPTNVIVRCLILFFSTSTALESHPQILH